MVIYILKTIFTWLFLVLLLSQISFAIAYFSPNALLGRFDFFDAYALFFQQIMDGQFAFLSSNNTSFLSAFFSTFELCIFALFISLMIGIPIGILLGVGSINWFNNLIQIVSLILYSCPIVWLMTLILFLLYSNNSLLINDNLILPTEGVSLFKILMTTAPNKVTLFTEQFKIMLVPIMILAIQPSIITIQVVSESVSKVIKRNYIKMAMIRETSSLTILRRHLLPNTIPSILPRLAYNTTTLLFSVMVMEILLNINGLGKWVMLAYYQHNYNIIAIAILTCGTFISVFILFFEIVTAIFYPLYYKENYAK